MTVQALRKQVDADANVYQPEEARKMTEKIEVQMNKPVALDHLREQSIYLERLGCAVSSLGDLMGMMEYKLDVVTVTGLGELLKILGNDMLDTSLKEYDHSRATKA